MNESSAIEIRNLGKCYGPFTALTDVSLTVRSGEVFGLLGPNGAGKTTTLRLLMGLLAASSGHARIEGLDCLADRVALKRRVGFLPDNAAFYDYLTGRELLHFVGEMHGLPRATLHARREHLLSELGLEDAAGDYAVHYSLGMKKRLSLCMAVIHGPSVLLLDEPTTGLDPLGTRHVLKLIRAWAAEGRTVVLSTHLLDMAERLCDRVAILYQGSLAGIGTPESVRARASGVQETSRSAPGPACATLEEAFFAITGGSPS